MVDEEQRQRATFPSLNLGAIGAGAYGGRKTPDQIRQESINWGQRAGLGNRISFAGERGRDILNPNEMRVNAPSVEHWKEQAKRKMWMDMRYQGEDNPYYGQDQNWGSSAGITNPNLNGYKVLNAGGPIDWLSKKYYDYRTRKDEEEAAKERRRFYDLPGSKLMQYQNPHTREIYTQDEYFPPEHPTWDEENETLTAEASGASFDAMRHELFRIGIDPTGIGDDEIRQIYDINIGGTTGGEDQFGIAKIDPWDWRNLETIIKAGENPEDYVETSNRGGLMSFV